MYNPNYDTELIGDRSTCKSLCQDYNETRYTNETRRTELIHKLLKAKGSFLIEQPFWCDYGYNIEIGNNFYSNRNLVILDGAKVTIGDNAFISPNCGLYTARPAERNAGLEYAKPISIGHNVWIGGNVSYHAGC